MKSKISNINKNLDKSPLISAFKMFSFWVAFTFLVILALFPKMNLGLKYISVYIILVAICYEMSKSIFLGCLIASIVIIIIWVINYFFPNVPILEGFEGNDDKDAVEEVEDKIKDDVEEVEDKIKEDGEYLKEGDETSINEAKVLTGSSTEQFLGGEEDDGDPIPNLDLNKLKKFRDTQKMLQATASDLSNTLNVLQPTLEKTGNVIKFFQGLGIDKK